MVQRGRKSSVGVGVVRFHSSHCPSRCLILVVDARPRWGWDDCGHHLARLTTGVGIPLSTEPAWCEGFHSVEYESGCRRDKRGTLK